jgi:lipopolysaccharide transport system permease protein
MDNHEKWDLEIKPKASLFDLNLPEIWRYKDLIILFVRRDFVAQYKQTILGPVWHFIQPILTTLMFLFIFTKVAHIPTDGITPVLFYMSGITVWNYFSLTLNATSSTFLSNASIFGKVYFPRIIMPVSVIISNLIRFGIQFLLLIVAIIWYYFQGVQLTLSVYVLALPLLLLLLAGIGLGVGIIISSVTTKYRDFTVLLAFAIQLLMYGTPIAYPLSFLQKTGFAWIIRLNPLTSIVEAFRFVLFGKGTFSANDLLYSTGFMFVVLFIGLIVFNKTEKSFIDTV